MDGWMDRSRNFSYFHPIFLPFADFIGSLSICHLALASQSIQRIWAKGYGIAFTLLGSKDNPHPLFGTMGRKYEELRIVWWVVLLEALVMTIWRSIDAKSKWMVLSAYFSFLEKAKLDYGSKWLLIILIHFNIKFKWLGPHCYLAHGMGSYPPLCHRVI